LDGSTRPDRSSRPADDREVWYVPAAKGKRATAEPEEEGSDEESSPVTAAQPLSLLAAALGPERFSQLKRASAAFRESSITASQYHADVVQLFKELGTLRTFAKHFSALNAALPEGANRDGITSIHAAWLTSHPEFLPKVEEAETAPAPAPIAIHEDTSSHSMASKLGSTRSLPAAAAAAEMWPTLPAKPKPAQATGWGKPALQREKSSSTTFSAASSHVEHASEIQQALDMAISRPANKHSRAAQKPDEPTDELFRVVTKKPKPKPVPELQPPQLSTGRASAASHTTEDFPTLQSVHDLATSKHNSKSSQKMIWMPKMSTTRPEAALDQMISVVSTVKLAEKADVLDDDLASMMRGIGKNKRR
jgi:hypothetical protein